MTNTNKHNTHRHHDREKYDSRIKQTRAYILDNNLSGLLNNQKWQKIFEWVERNQTPFTLTTLLNSNEQTCTFIRELENNSILIDDSGQFIDFLEINKLTVSKSLSLTSFLAESSIDYADNDKTTVIIGYR